MKLGLNVLESAHVMLTSKISI